MYDGILLEPEQQDLLCTLVEASRSVPRDKRRKFSVARTADGDFLVHSSVPEAKRRIYYGDVEILATNGLVLLSFSSQGSPVFDVTPHGYKYYEHLMEAKGEPVARVVKTIHSYIDQGMFSNTYPEAYTKWMKAEELLWSAETESQFTTVGHLCREAMQEYASQLAQLHKVSSAEQPKTKTVQRVREVLDKKRPNLGGTEQKFLGALLSYWGTVSDLVQRQEHGAAKEGQAIVWEDARRVTFQTLIVMYEIDRAMS